MTATAPLLGRATVSARLLGHPALMLGGPRALLMQVANPGVAAGVARHSDFASDPLGRLARTLTAMDRIAFGRPEKAAAALAALDARHRRVRGVTADGVGYSAQDPDLVLWVHATLVDTALEVESRYLGMLDDDERARFYDESRLLARAFHLPDEIIPPDLDSFRAYMSDAVESLEVGDDGLRIARNVIRPPFGASLGPPGAVLSAVSAPVLEAVTADLLPERLRRSFGLRTGAGTGPGALAVAAAAAFSRVVSPRLPWVLTRPGTVARLVRELAPGGLRRSAPHVGGRRSPASSARHLPGSASTNGKSTTEPVPRSQ